MPRTCVRGIQKINQASTGFYPADLSAQRVESSTIFLAEGGPPIFENKNAPCYSHRACRKINQASTGFYHGEAVAPNLIKTNASYLRTRHSKNKSGIDLLSHTVTRIVPSALRGLTSLFGMGRGVTPAIKTPEF